jgi:hypothetical protein
MFKSRLCCRGFLQRLGVDYNETFAPVVQAASLRIQLADAVRRKLHLAQIDFDAAFLQSKIDGDIYVKSPHIKTPHGYCLKLKRSMYGLKQAAFLWNAALEKLLLANNFRQTKGDPCLFIYDDGTIYMSISTWVDDCIICHNNTFAYDKFIATIKSTFNLSAQTNLDFVLGMEITQSGERDTIELSHKKYISDMITKFNLLQADCTKVDTPALTGQDWSKGTAAESGKKSTDKPYRELLGTLSYLAQWTRPDIAPAISMLARHQNDPYVIHWKALVRVAKYVKNTKDKCLRFSEKTGGTGDLHAFVDANFSTCKDTSKSRSGYIFFMMSGPIVWQTGLQSVVAQSTAESEYIAANAVAREAEWVKIMYDDVVQGNYGTDKSLPVNCFEDNQACITLALKFLVNKAVKHIRYRYHYVKQQVRDGIIQLSYIPSKDNVADLFTKVLGRIDFIRHRDTMVVDSVLI